MNINFDGDLRADLDEEEEEISDVGTVNPCWQNAPQQLCKYLYAQASRAHVMRKSKRLIHESVTRCVTRCYVTRGNVENLTRSRLKLL